MNVLPSLLEGILEGLKAFLVELKLLGYLLSATRAGEGQRGVFGPLRLSFNVPSLVQQDLHHTHMARSGR